MKGFSAILVVCLMLAGRVAVAQQQGFGGGGFGGISVQDRVQIDELMATFRDSSILTATEDAPYPVKVDADDGLIVKVSSDDFDTFVKVVDEDGTVLAENDDAEPGTQDSRLVVSFPQGGTYKVIVQGFQSKGGGQFDIEMSRFRTVPSKVGETVTVPKGSPWKFTSFEVERGDVVEIVPGESGSVPIMILDASGQVVDPGPRGKMMAWGTPFVLQAQLSGTYYVAFRWSERGESTVRIMDVPMVERSFGGPDSITVQDGAVWLRLEGKKGDTVTFEEDPAQDAFGYAFLDMPWLEPLKSEEEDEETGIDFEVEDGSTQVMKTLPLGKAAKPGQQAFQFVSDGVATILLWQRGQEANKMTWGPLADDLTLGFPVTRNLPIGGVQFYSFEAESGEWLEFAMQSKQFDSMLVLYRANGEQVLSADDWKGSVDAWTRSWVEEGGKFILQVSSTGGGGGGEYSLTSMREPIPAFSGDALEAQLPENGVKVWSMDLKEGEQFMLRSKTASMNLVLVPGQEKEGLISRSVDLDGERLLIVRAKRDIKARLWVTGPAGQTIQVVKEGM